MINDINRDKEIEDFLKQIEKDNTILDNLSLKRLRILRDYCKKRVQKKKDDFSKLNKKNDN